MAVYYGFSIANDCQEPAWFHTEAAAARFATDCGWDDAEIEIMDAEEINKANVIDRPDRPYTAGQLTDQGLLRAAIDRSGLSDRKFATTIMVRDERTIRRWLAGDRAIPKAVLDWIEQFMCAV